MDKRNLQIFREKQVIHEDSTNIKINNKMSKKTINSLQLMKPAKESKPNKVQFNTTKTVRNISYEPNIDQSAYLKFFDGLTNEWKDDIYTDNPDVMI